MRLTILTRMRRGFTMIELVVVLVVVGAMTAIVAPRFRVSEAMEVQLAARQLAHDLDFARTRALAARATVRVAFDVSGGTYSGYMDTNDDGTIAQSPDERQRLQGFGMRELSARLNFARGETPDVPGVSGGGAVSFEGSAATFDTRGLVTPLGSSGAVYIRHKSKPEKIAAVAVTAAGNVRVWTWRDGEWE